MKIVSQYKTVVSLIWTIFQFRSKYAVKSSLRYKHCYSGQQAYIQATWSTAHANLQRNGFWLWSGCPCADVDESGSSGWGRFPGMLTCPSEGWVKELGKDKGWLLAGRGREALYCSELGVGDVEVGRIWLSVSRGCSLWNGFVTEGALRPKGSKSEKHHQGFHACNCKRSKMSVQHPSSHPQLFSHSFTQ